MSSAPPVRVREGSVEDAPQIVTVFRAARARMDYLPDLHTPEEDLAFFGRGLAEGGSFLAEVDAGAGTQSVVIGFALHDATLLNHLYVHPNTQGRGIGSTLIEHVKRALPGGFDLWLFQPNGGARRFYARHGLVCVEETDGAGNEERVPDARYRWSGAR